jgi:hypothetical protein
LKGGNIVTSVVKEVKCDKTWWKKITAANRKSRGGSKREKEVNGTTVPGGV